MEIERVRRSCSLLVERGYLRDEQVTTLVLAWKQLAQTKRTTTSLAEVLLELGYVTEEEVNAVRSICSLSHSQSPGKPQLYAIEELPFRKPEDFSRYEILEELSRGGMGVVFRARHKALGNEVALKAMLNPTPNDSARARFRQEARVLAKLSHPNIVSVSDLGEEDGRLFCVMELVNGFNLEDTYQREERLGVEWCVGIVREIALALEFCHSNGVIHRDVKPTNVIVEQEKGLPILVDFGLVHLGGDERVQESHAPAATPTIAPVRREAKPEKASSFVTAAGHVVGTPGFMAPEQISPGIGEIGPRSDVYSLAATLYYLLTGRAPFEGKGVMKILTAVLRDDPAPLRSLNPRVPEAVATVCHLALSREPNDRPASAALFGQALKRALDGEASEPKGKPLSASASGRLKPTFPKELVTETKSKRGGLSIKWSVVSVPHPEAAGPALKEEPKGFRTLLKRGARRFKKRDYPGAVGLLTEAIQLFDHCAEAFTNRGAAHYMQKEYAQALADFSAALALEPDDVATYRRRGRAHFKSRDFEAAVADFTEVIRLAPEEPDGYHKRGVAYYRLNARKKAADDEARARRLAWGPISGVDEELEEPSDELKVLAPVEKEPEPRPEPAPVTLLTLVGVLDSSTTDSLEQLLQKLLLEGHTRILVDGVGLTHLGSRSATVFLSLLRPLRLAGGDLKFCQLSERATTVFSTLGLDELLELGFETLDPALLAFDQPLRPEWLDALREGCVGLVTSEEYHRPTCEAVKAADPAFQVWFEGEDEAVLAGRRACPKCSG
jgi:serine/threonine protein kinase/anti-anti-sigma regulatory factor